MRCFCWNDPASLTDTWNNSLGRTHGTFSVEKLASKSFQTAEFPLGAASWLVSLGYCRRWAPSEEGKHVNLCLSWGASRNTRSTIIPASPNLPTGS